MSRTKPPLQPRRRRQRLWHLPPLLRAFQPRRTARKGSSIAFSAGSRTTKLRRLRTKNPRRHSNPRAKAVVTVVATGRTGTIAVETAVAVIAVAIVAAVTAAVAVTVAISVRRAKAAEAKAEVKVVARAVRRAVTVPSVATAVRVPSVKGAIAVVNATASSVRRARTAKAVAKVVERTAAKAGGKDVRRAVIVRRVMSAETAAIAVRAATTTAPHRMPNGSRARRRQSIWTSVSPM